MAARKVMSLSGVSGVHRPDYRLAVYKNGDPRRRLSASQVNLRSVTAIQTSKATTDLAGTFTITLKDGRARRVIREMDVIPIRLRGHYSQSFHTVLNGVVDTVREATSSDPYASSEDTVITGRCPGKYLQVTSLFLPVWDPEALLPTALTFGLGDAAKKVDGNRPFDIFRYLVKRFTYGDRDLAGVSGIPTSRYWLDHYTRFSRRLGFQVPFLQFDESSMAEALKRLEVLGYTETWIDELGRVVYRQPAWDAPISYSISTNAMLNDGLERGDLETATYVEVVPAGDPGISSATAQALRSGRAPVPSSYLSTGSDTTLADSVSPEFVIQTDRHGKVTKEGARNAWYRRQRRLGLRPQQISSPLIFTQEQAQAQAEGLLRFYSRMSKGGSITVPGAPELRLGTTGRVHGNRDGGPIDRTYFLEAITHDYVEDEAGGSYTTGVTLTHGRDPWDPHWRSIALPRFDPSKLAQDTGTLDENPDTGSSSTDGTPSGPAPKGSPGDIINTIVLPMARAHGIDRTVAQNNAGNATHGGVGGGAGSGSDHQGPPTIRWAADMSNGTRPTPEMDALAAALAKRFGIEWDGSGLANATHDGYRYQLIYRIDLGAQGGNHYNHVHCGVKKVG